MSFYFVSHAWEVKNLDDGLMVAVSQRELDPDTVSVLDDELVELIRESGQANLCVDFQNVSSLPSSAMEKLVSLEATLRTMDCRLSLCNLDPSLHQSLPTALTDKLKSIPANKRMWE